MSAGPTLAVTGSTGRLGGRVARLLAAANMQQRLVVRNPARAPRLDAAQIAVAEYGDAGASRRALDGMRTVFMVSGSETPDRVAKHRAFVDAAAAAGVEHVVDVSFYGAAADANFTSPATTGPPSSTSGPAACAGFSAGQPVSGFPAMVGDDGMIRGPAGSGRLPPSPRTTLPTWRLPSFGNLPRMPARPTTSPDRRLSPSPRWPTSSGRYRERRRVRPRDSRGGLPLARPLRRPRLAGRRLGKHLHRDSCRRARRDERRRRASSRAPAYGAPGVADGPLA